MNPTTPQITARQFPQVYIDLGIDPSNLGCIMLDIEPIVVSDTILYDDLYQTDPKDHPHMQGIVSESSAHCTLLYGLLRSGMELKKHVDAVLDGWIAQDVTIAGVDVFPSNKPGENYVTLIAKLEVTPNLLEANARLKCLPHLDTFSSYSPHTTLCYLNDLSDYQGYIQKLNGVLQGKTVKALDINYGD